jgi:hypothetical protein
VKGSRWEAKGLLGWAIKFELIEKKNSFPVFFPYSQAAKSRL